jgi:dipeptidyl aminopeptidase/acylaminoacyl peptidase
MNLKLATLALIMVAFSSCTQQLVLESLPVTTEPGQMTYEKEKHFKNIHQVTYGGDNAEAYWSPDGKQLIFQSNKEKWFSSCFQCGASSSSQETVRNSDRSNDSDHSTYFRHRASAAFGRKP